MAISTMSHGDIDGNDQRIYDVQMFKAPADTTHPAPKIGDLHVAPFPPPPTPPLTEEERKQKEKEAKRKQQQRMKQEKAVENKLKKMIAMDDDKMEQAMENV